MSNTWGVFEEWKNGLLGVADKAGDKLLGSKQSVQPGQDTMRRSDGLIDQFEFIVNLTVLACLVPYLFVSASYIIVLIEKKLHLNKFFKTFFLGGLGFSYSLWAIYGSGSNVVFYGFLLLLLGIPFYTIMQWNKSK